MSILDLFAGLDRCAPADAASLIRAARGLPQDAAILDAGCGTGGDLETLLTLAPQGRVTAIDLAEEFIAGVRARWPEVRAEVADMLDPPPGPYDLIWSGGAIYSCGIGPALSAWSRHLAPGGRVIFTDLALRGRVASPDVAAFFAAEGVPLRDANALLADVRATGWAVTDSFWLPDSAWDVYYLPLEARMDEIAGDPAFAEVIPAFRTEIALWRSNGAEYGYMLVSAVPG